MGASDSKLCAKKDIIIKKFDDLLRKLGGEELALNISLGKMSAQWHAAMEGWLDSESQYRLRIEQAKEARQGSKFAEEEYEKYRQAQKEAEENYNVGKAKHDKEVRFVIYSRGCRVCHDRLTRSVGTGHAFEAWSHLSEALKTCCVVAC